MQGSFFLEITCMKRNFVHIKGDFVNFVHGRLRAKEISCMNRNFMHGDFNQTENSYSLL